MITKGTVKEKRYLDFKQQYELVKRSLNGDENATIELLTFLTPFVIKYAGRYISSNVSFEDLVQEGYYAILYAIPKYRPDKRTTFSTYSSMWVIKRMRECSSRGIIKVPEHQGKCVNRYLRYVDDYITQYGFEPGDDQVMTDLDIDRETLDKYRTTPYVYMLDMPEICKDAESDHVDDTLLRLIIEESLSCVTPLERQVISSRWGLNGCVPKPRIEVAKEIGWSCEWTRQIELSALAKLKEHLESIDFFDERDFN